MYTSVIKINGHGILPPVLNPERRQEMRRERKRAIEKEKLLHQRRNSCLLDNIQDVIQRCTQEVDRPAQVESLARLDSEEPASCITGVKSTNLDVMTKDGQNVHNSFAKESEFDTKQMPTADPSSSQDMLKNSGNEGVDVLHSLTNRIRMMEVTVGMLEEDDTDVSVCSNLVSYLQDERGSDMSSIMGNIKQAVHKSSEIEEKREDPDHQALAVAQGSTASNEESYCKTPEDIECTSNFTHIESTVSKFENKRNPVVDVSMDVNKMVVSNKELEKNAPKNTSLTETTIYNIEIPPSGVHESSSADISGCLVSTTEENVYGNRRSPFECSKHVAPPTGDNSAKTEDVCADISNTDISEVSECVTASVDLKPFMHRDSSMDEDSTLVETTPFPCASPIPGLSAGTSSGSSFQTTLREDLKTPTLEATSAPGMVTVKLVDALEFPTSVFLEHSSETSTQSPIEASSSLASTRDGNHTSPNEMSCKKEEVIGFPLIRSLSYTLENPSPILLEYMKRSGKAEVPKSRIPKTKSENSASKNKFEESNRNIVEKMERAVPPCDKVRHTSSERSLSSMNFVKPSKGPNSPAKDRVRMSIKSELKVDSPKFCLTPKSKRIRDLKNHLFQQYETEWYQMMEEQKLEQDRLQHHFETQRKMLIDKIKDESPVEPARELVNKVLEGGGEEKAILEGKKRKCVKQIAFSSNEDGEDFACKVASTRKQNTSKQDIGIQLSRSPSSSPKKSRGVSPYTCVERSFLGGRSPVMKGIVVGRSPHKPARHPNLPIPQQAFLPENQRKFEKVSAAVKGYLTRRLFRTERVRTVIDTVRDTAVVAHNFLIEARTRATKQDMEFNKRVCAQLKSALLSLHEVFISLTPAEQMAIINQDRIMNVVSRPQPQARPLSAATVKALERRRKKEGMNKRCESASSTPMSARSGRPASSASGNKTTNRKLAVVSSERPKSAPSFAPKTRERRSVPCRSTALKSPTRIQGNRTYVVKSGVR